MNQRPGSFSRQAASTRMGHAARKPLLPWRGEPFIRHVARTALAAGLSPVVIVAGAHVADIRCRSE